VFDHIEVTDGCVWLKQSGVKHFAGDLPILAPTPDKGDRG
jgi:hypothetical protein